MRYAVTMSNGNSITVEADIAIVSEYGALTFRKDAQIIAAFPPTGWVRLRREDQ